MPRYRPFLILGVAVIIALVTSAMMYQWLNQAKAQPGPVQAIKTEALSVATAELPWGTKLTREMIEVVPFPAGNLPEGYFQDRESLVGRVVLVNLKRNESILESKLAPVSITTGGVSAVTNPEKRAMAVKVDEVVGVAGFIKPGDRVDVMVTINPSRSGESVLAKLVLSNTLVLATGTETERKGGNEKATPVTVITLEVTPEEAEKLALATTEGKLRLALRNPMNTDVALTKGATINSLLSSYRVFEKPEKAPDRSKKLVEPKADNKVEIIKGGTVSSVKFGHEM